MSLLFSEVEISRKGHVRMTLYESGHPDEYDMRELLEYEDRYAAVRAAGLAGTTVRIRHYRFSGGGARDWLAEREHLALMEAYNEAVPDQPFTEREDVEHLEYFAFQIEK